jgi:tellurite methyltransferase
MKKVYATRVADLASAVKRFPESKVRAFRQDEEGPWVAELECGHAQHVRHRPPMETREWVLTDEGRRGRIGASFPCRYCLMPRIPGTALEYKRTPTFDKSTTPAGLLRSHTTKEGVWGEVVVVAGRVLYVIEPVIEPEEGASFVLKPGVTGTIAPLVPHHVDPEDDAKFFVRFLR